MAPRITLLCKLKTFSNRQQLNLHNVTLPKQVQNLIRGFRSHLLVLWSSMQQRFSLYRSLVVNFTIIDSNLRQFMKCFIFLKRKSFIFQPYEIKVDWCCSDIILTFWRYIFIFSKEIVGVHALKLFYGMRLTYNCIKSCYYWISYNNSIFIH